MSPGTEHPPPSLCSEPGELERPGGGPALLSQPRPLLQGQQQLQEEPGEVRADLQRGQRDQDMRRPLSRLQGRHGGDTRHRPQDQLCLCWYRRRLQGTVRVYRVSEAVLGQSLCRWVRGLDCPNKAVCMQRVPPQISLQMAWSKLLQ